MITWFFIRTTVGSELKQQFPLSTQKLASPPQYQRDSCMLAAVDSPGFHLELQFTATQPTFKNFHHVFSQLLPVPEQPSCYAPCNAWMLILLRISLVWLLGGGTTPGGLLIKRSSFFTILASRYGKSVQLTVDTRAIKKDCKKISTCKCEKKAFGLNLILLFFS